MIHSGVRITNKLFINVLVQVALSARVKHCLGIIGDRGTSVTKCI